MGTCNRRVKFGLEISAVWEKVSKCQGGFILLTLYMGQKHKHWVTLCFAETKIQDFRLKIKQWPKT